MAEKQTKKTTSRSSSKNAATKQQGQTQNIKDNKPIVTQTEVNNAEKTELVAPETKERLSESEKKAVEMQEQTIQTGAAAVRYFKLRNERTQYTDTEANWSITGDEVKELPANPSSETLERIKHGFLVEVTNPSPGQIQGQGENDGETPEPEDGQVTTPVEGPAEIVDPDKEN